MDFPEEIALEIFSKLPLSDLKNVVQVCRLWKNLGENSVLWKSCPIRVNRKNWKEVVKTPRLSLSTKVQISEDDYQADELDAILLDVMEHEAIKEMIMGDSYQPELCSMSSIGKMFLFTPRMEEKYPDGKGYKGISLISFGPQHSGQIDIAPANSNLVSKCFNKMEKLEFNKYENREFKLSVQQTQDFYREMSQQTDLKHMKTFFDFEFVNPDIFANAVTKLESFQLVKAVGFEEWCGGEDQIVALFRKMSQEDTNLKQIYNTCFLISSVSPDYYYALLDVLPAAVLKLETLVLRSSSLTKDMFITIFRLFDGSSKLKNLCLMEEDMIRWVQEDFLGLALNKLERVKLCQCKRIVSTHVREILNHAGPESKLKYLDVSSVYLADEPELIQEAETKIEEFVHNSDFYDNIDIYDADRDIQQFLSGCGAR